MILMLNSCEYKSPIGMLYLFSNGEALCKVSMDAPTLNNEDEKSQDDLLAKAKEELEEYFSHRRRYFSCPLFLKGTPFQQKILSLVQDIPYGGQRTYGELGGGQYFPRAVGGALKRNPLPIFIPCHRVVGKKGLTGFGLGLEVKSYLLNLEKEGNFIHERRDRNGRWKRKG